MSNCLQPHGLQHASFPSPSPTPGVCSNSCLLIRWCHPTISSFLVPFSSCLQSSPASGSFQMGHFLASGDQRIGVSASASFLPKNTQGWCPSEWTGWVSFQSKGLSTDFSNTTVQKHQFFGAHLSLYSTFQFSVDKMPSFRWSQICQQCRRPTFNPWAWKIPWRGKWQHTPVFLPRESHGQEEPGGL